MNIFLFLNLGSFINILLKFDLIIIKIAIFEKYLKGQNHYKKVYIYKASNKTSETLIRNA